jgi:aspartyl/asparaginyl beta-hydroxylase (cupin superfamily)
VYGLAYPERIQLFPQTYKIISELKGVSTVYFSFLNAESKIQPHNGDTDAYYRIHLGIKIPAQLPDCGLEVAGEKLAWQEGKCFAFNDIYYHKAWNLTNENRVVLIIDLARPEFRDDLNKVNSGVIATLILSRLYKYIGIIIELFPRILTRLIHPIFHQIVFTYFKFKYPKK